MLSTGHHYSNTDTEYEEINHFLLKVSKENEFQLWDPGRFNFWRYNIHANKKQTHRFFQENVHIWRSRNIGIAGLAISEYGGNDIFIEVLYRYKHIYPGIIEWIETVWAKDKSEIDMDIISIDHKKIKLLKDFGFLFHCYYENFRIYYIDNTDLSYTLRDGFAIQTLSELKNKENRVSLVRSVFNNKEYSIKNITGIMSSPDYNHRYDLSVMEKNSGLQIAYCIGWQDKKDKKSGYIEPVGTHPNYRKQGFGKAIIKECFRRMYKDGILMINIASRAEPAISNYLYESLGPVYKREIHKYKKTIQR